MAETIDDATLIAWLDGELDGAAATQVATAVAADPALAALAERHRGMKARFAAAFDPLAQEAEPSAPPASATLHSLADARARRTPSPAAPRRPIRWTIPGALAASLVVGVLTGHLLIPRPGGIGDDRGALTLSPSIATALDRQLSGEPGAVRVALSFRDTGGDLCRSFSARHLTGVACRDRSGWQLRYGAAGAAQVTDYRMAGGNEDVVRVVDAMIAGAPLDRADEEAARAKSWKE